MEVDNSSLPTVKKITYREEVAKPVLVLVKYTPEGSGVYLTRTIADSITGLKEHYSIVIIDMIEKK